MLMLYELMRAELPDTILVSVSHRASVQQFHTRRLELVGGGEWRLELLRTLGVAPLHRAGAGPTGYLARDG